MQSEAKSRSKVKRKRTSPNKDEYFSSTTTDSAISIPENSISSSSSLDSGVNEPSKRRRRTGKQSTSKKHLNDTGKCKTKHRPYTCYICNKQFLGTSDLRKHLLIHADERPFPCEFCDRKFRQAICLKNHVAAIHGTDKEFACEHCDKKFPIKERLRLHMRIHLGQKPYSCPSCPKTFARGGQLKQHLVTHSGGNKHGCDQCTASFASLGNLRLHSKIHLGQTDHICQICKKKFFRSEDLKRHIAGIHKNNKTFICEICNKTLRGHLHQHMKVHDNDRAFGCETCGAHFCQKSQLNVHQRTHSGERPYRCQVCWRAFAHSSVLKLHIRKHTGEKPFQCLLCKENGIAFSQLAHLKTHMRTIHGKDKPYMCEGCQEFFKIKAELRTHCQNCSKILSSGSTTINKDFAETENAANLSKLRLLVVVVLKKISTEDKLKKLGFEKRLIDNVFVDALKMAGRTVISDPDLSELERLKMNIKEFLLWTIPESSMKTLEKEKKSIEKILEDLAWTYSKERRD